MKKTFALVILLAGMVLSQSLTVHIQPQYMEGINGTNANRIPFAFLATISGLTPDSVYRYFNQIVISTDAATQSGAGNVIFVRADSPFVRSTGPSMSTAGNYGEFRANSSGSYTGWFVTEPTGNATRFVPGKYVFPRIMLNNGAGGTSVATRLTSPDSTKVIALVNTASDTSGTGIWSRSTAPAKSFVLLYDNEAGTGRPLAATFVEDDGTANTTANSYAAFYSDSVNAIPGSWGAAIPNNNANGVRRIEARDMTGNLLPHPATDADGLWGTVNTVNPTGGTTALRLPPELVPLPVEFTSFTATTSGNAVTLTWTTATELNNRGFEVERKTSVEWQNIGFVAGSGTTTDQKTWSFRDENASGGKMEYRLKQVDFDGTFSYSNTIEIDLNPTVFSLEQNFPNPFNPSTVIRYALPVAGNVTLNVYNSLGEKVAELVNGIMPAGNHTVQFDASKLNSGLYIYEIKAGSFTASRKMLFIK